MFWHENIVLKLPELTRCRAGCGLRVSTVQPDTGVDESCLINTTYSPPYHFQNLIRSFVVACGPAELVEVRGRGFDLLDALAVNFAQADTIVF